MRTGAELCARSCSVVVTSSDGDVEGVTTGRGAGMKMLSAICGPQGPMTICQIKIKSGFNNQPLGLFV